MKNLAYSFLIALFVLTWAKTIHAQGQTISNISVDSAYALTQLYAQNPNFVILDVRMPIEYNGGHIDKAVNLDFLNANFGKTLDSMPKTKIYLIHCAAGSRSIRARDSMANRNFQTVYNMLGGINAWKLKYPTTLLTTPVLLAYGSTNVDLGYIAVGQTDTLEITITNGANDTLKFNSINGPNNLKFSTNFSLSKQLLGYDNYKFQVTYTPTNLMSDTTSLTIYSNGGSLKFYLKAHGSAVGIDNIASKKDFKIYPNPATNYITIETQKEQNTQFDLLNSQGKIIHSYFLNKQKEIFDISTLPSGMYFIKNSKQMFTFIKK